MTKTMVRVGVWAVASGLLMLVWAVAGERAAADEAIVRVQGPVEEVKAEEGEVDVQVVVEGASNLGAFQFELTFDPDILEFVDVKEGPFLGSTGRETLCIEPSTEDGRVFYGCNSKRPEPPGPDGDGLLATMTLAPREAGTSDLALGRVILGGLLGESLPVAPRDGSITVVDSDSGVSWALWGPVIAVAVIVLGGLAIFGARWLRQPRHA